MIVPTKTTRLRQKQKPHKKYKVSKNKITTKTKIEPFTHFML